MHKKRPIREVRQELRQLDNELTHSIIRKIASGSDKYDAEIDEISAKIMMLTTQYPKAIKN